MIKMLKEMSHNDANLFCDPSWEECPTIIHSINPATLDVVGDAQTFVPEQIPDILTRARTAQQIWMTLSVKERRKKINRVVESLLSHMEEIAMIISKETGKPLIEALNSDVIAGISAAKYSAEMLPKLFAKKKIHFGGLHPFLRLLGRSSTLQYRPLGVIGIISPWNFPFSIPFSEVIMAVTAGNAVILKPSSETPLTALKIQDIFEKIDFPLNLVQVIPGSGSKLGKALVTSGVDKVVFTGSAEVGKKIMEIAAQKTIPVTLELSGKDPMIILDDADLDRVIAAATWGSFVNSGQMCVGIKRIYVHSSLYSQFLNLFADRVRSLKQGWNLSDPNISIGPLINEAAIHEMEQHVKNALDQGAQLITGGKRNPALKGYFFEPTIFANVTQDMDIVHHEIFGPIVAIIPFNTDDEAIQYANDNDFALAGSVWTRNVHRGIKIADKLKSGSILVNNVAYTFGLTATPWGGQKKSGFGRTHGELGFHDLMEPHHIHIDKGRFSRELWWNPYTKEKLQGNYDFARFAFSSKKVYSLQKIRRIFHILRGRN